MKKSAEKKEKREKREKKERERFGGGQAKDNLCKDGMGSKREEGRGSEGGRGEVKGEEEEEEEKEKAIYDKEF